ncbi:tubulin-specific chaperone E-like isoform X3 [Scylla paramamosain]|uniref:tubulin-specific chaperone E-like isoform X3 n=1 Tax=Scylla paramamosain TaxID=85552 RepID=UPI0030831901
MMESNVGIGRRVECDGHRGTIHWIGELPPAQGTWYGIDWDDASRGRHDGSHNNIKYFQTRYPTSGSFVRPAKVNTGITFEKAIRGRYQDDATVESEVMEQLQREINARFVEVVGMDKVGRKQSGNMLCIPDHPEELKKSLNHVVHLVLNNMLVYSWMDLLTCCTMFPELRNLQVAFNKLDVLGPIPCGVFDCLEELDIGENPISSWEEICHLGSLPRLESLNANSCCLKRITFPSTSATDKTPLFPHLERLMLANNPLDTWECTGELNKLSKMEYLVISYNVKTSRYFQEFTFARISKLKVLNRTELSPKEKRDCELFYLKTFSSEYYKNGGKEDQNSNSLSQEFIEKHPTYLRLIKAHGAPLDDTDFKTQKSQKLKDLKVELKIIILSEPQREETFKFFLLTTKVAKVKMMLKRHLKINPSTNLKLSYCSTKDGGFEIPMDNDQQDLAFYSVENGDVLLISL